jgi:hypothetical protein
MCRCFCTCSVRLLFNYYTLLCHIYKSVALHLYAFLIKDFLAHPIAERISEWYNLFTNISSCLHCNVWIRFCHPCIMDNHLKTLAWFSNLRRDRVLWIGSPWGLLFDGCRQPSRLIWLQSLIPNKYGFWLSVLSQYFSSLLHLVWWNSSCLWICSRSRFQNEFFMVWCETVVCTNSLFCIKFSLRNIRWWSNSDHKLHVVGMNLIGHLLKIYT